MTENQAIECDKAADALAAAALCTGGASDCPGRTAPVTTPPEPAPEMVFRRCAPGTYRQTGPARLYVCRFCRTIYQFPEAVNEPTEPANHDSDARVD